MNKSALQDIQQALNAIRSEIERVDDETKWVALELMLASSASVVALAKKITKPDTKTVTRKISIPKTKVIKQPVQQANPMRTTQFELLSIPSLPKNCYPTNKAVNKHLKITR